MLRECDEKNNADYPNIKEIFLGSYNTLCLEPHNNIMHTHHLNGQSKSSCASRCVQNPTEKRIKWVYFFIFKHATKFFVLDGNYVLTELHALSMTMLDDELAYVP